MTNSRMPLKGLRARLTPKQVALLKLVVWVVILVWMVFFLAQSVLVAQTLSKWVPGAFPQTLFHQSLARLIPYWYVFTIGLVEFIIARWAFRKLKGKKKPTNNNVSKGENTK